MKMMRCVPAMADFNSLASAAAMLALMTVARSIAPVTRETRHIRHTRNDVVHSRRRDVCDACDAFGGFAKWARRWQINHDPRAFGFDLMIVPQRNAVLNSISDKKLKDKDGKESAVSPRDLFQLQIQAAHDTGLINPGGLTGGR